MKISDRHLGISDSLKISDFSNSLGGAAAPPSTPSNTPMEDSRYFVEAYEKAETLCRFLSLLYNNYK